MTIEELLGYFQRFDERLKRVEALVPVNQRVLARVDLQQETILREVRGHRDDVAGLREQLRQIRVYIRARVVGEDSK